MIKQQDSLQFLKELPDYFADINYSDPPYALGSEIIIREDGKVDYKKAVDFMSKWDMPTGDYWEKWFKEAYRTLKYGGTLIMFGMDRQLLLFKYYAQLAGFEEQQSMYWYYISGFPKATDLSKMIDKNLGVDRKVIGVKKGVGSNKTYSGKQGLGKSQEFGLEYDDTESNSDLGKKYEGYKYSIAPLKQTNETIMVFRKPYKSGSCLHDTLAYENGDNECRCGALNIDGNRVETTENLNGGGYNIKGTSTKDLADASSYATKVMEKEFKQPYGRYPSQTFCDSNTAEVLDRQSGIQKRSERVKIQKEKRLSFSDDTPTFNSKNSGFKPVDYMNYNDTGGASRILHTCDFEKGEYDLYHYNPKVSGSERNAGCESMENKKGGSYKFRQDGGLDGKIPTHFNSHPTLKPISLNRRILSLFKTPNPQKIIYPFAGAGSEIIGGIKAGFNDWLGCELNKEYIKIAEARIKHWSKKPEQKKLI